MEIKKCTKCLTEQPLENFSTQRNGKASRCKTCINAFVKNHYKENKQEYFDRNKKYRHKLRDRIQELKNVPCTDCKQTFPNYVMDFDHLTDKKFVVSRAVAKGIKFETILAEISKCEVVCSNCHRVRTYTRGQYNTHLKNKD